MHVKPMTPTAAGGFALSVTGLAFLVQQWTGVALAAALCFLGVVILAVLDIRSSPHKEAP